MLVRRKPPLSANLLELIKKFVLVPALLLLLLSGCDGKDDYEGGIGTMSGGVALEIGEITVGDSESKAKATVLIERDKLGSGAIEINLIWKCEILDTFKEGSVKVFVSSGEEKAETEITGLPAKPSLGNIIHCELKAIGDTYNVMNDFAISGDETPELEIEIITSKFATPMSSVQIKLLLTRDGKPLTEGDSWFDEAVEIEINWECGSAKGSQKTSIDAGKSDKVVAVGLSSVADGDGCRIFAQSMSGDLLTAGSDSKEFTLGEDRLKVVLTKHTMGEALGYLVTEDGNRFTDMVNLEIKGCDDTYLVRLYDSKNSAEYGKTISNVAPENEDSVFLLGSSGTCSIAVTSVVGDWQKQGRTDHASSFSGQQSADFSLRISDATIVPNSQKTFKGKIWVYIAAGGSSIIEGYLNTGISSINTATALQKSAADTTAVGTLKAGFYIVFYEQENVMRVFSGQYN